MKLKKGVTVYQLPEIGEIHRIVLDTGVKEHTGSLFHVQLVTLEQLEKFREATEPTIEIEEYNVQHAAAFVPPNHIHIWPPPRKSGMDLEIVYSPPLRRI